jgi:hypothetical protein
MAYLASVQLLARRLARPPVIDAQPLRLPALRFRRRSLPAVPARDSELPPQDRYARSERMAGQCRTAARFEQPAPCAGEKHTPDITTRANGGGQFYSSSLASKLDVKMNVSADA